MFSFGRPEVRQFGGVGAMLAEPGVQLVIRAAPRLSAEGPLAKRTLLAARRLAAAGLVPASLRCRIEVQSAPPLHVGLGAGTQLAMAVARGLCCFFGRPEQPPEVLAQAMGRGARSAIGLYGAFHGGLLVEAGKRTAKEISPLISRCSLPEAWRFVLIRPEGAKGLSGVAERSAFRALAPMTPKMTDELCRIALLELLPAARSGDFPEFSASLFQFGQLAGESFASQQGGGRFGAASDALAATLRRWKIRGIGQTSWGPTLFALLPDADAAAGLCAKLARLASPQQLWVSASSPCNDGQALAWS